MPSSEELQMAFDMRVDSHRHAGDEVEDYTRRVAALQKRVKSAEWDDLAELIHGINQDKGFWKEPEQMDKWVAKLMLVVTEVAEVTEALRKSQGTKAVTEEFADIFIRCLDIYSVLVTAGEADPNLYQVITDKIETNRTRPVKHGNRWG